MWVCQGSCNKGPHAEWLGGQQRTVLWIWRLQVPDQGAGQVGFLRGFPPGLGDSRLLPVSPHEFPRVHLCPRLLFFLQGHQPSWIRAHPHNLFFFFLSHFDLTNSLKTWCPNTVTLRSAAKLGLQYGWGDTPQAHKTLPDHVP